MGGIIPFAERAFSSAQTLLKSVVPFIMSQSDRLSRACASHGLRMASVDAIRQLLIDEAKSIVKTRDQIRQRLLDATPEEQIRLRRDLLDCDADVRKLNITAVAIERMADFVEPTIEGARDSGAETSSEAIPEHWMERFNSYARENSEEWRRELLSRALAMQAVNPDSVTLRALWLIGTLEKTMFDAFSTILDVSCQIDNSFLIPGNPNREVIQSCDLGKNIQIGSLLYRLSDTGLVADDNTKMQFDAGANVRIRYGASVYHIKCNGPLMVPCITPTVTGGSIARFYRGRHNSLGERLLTEWINSIRGGSHEITGPHSSISKKESLTELQ